MLTGARMALWNGKRSPLPPGARWVEYLESTGTQWINTGVKKTSGTTIDCTFSLSEINTKAIFGARTSAADLDRLMLMAIGSYFRFDMRYQQRLGIPDTTSIFRFQYDGADATLTNLTTGTTNTSSTPVGDAGALDISLFGVNTNGIVGSLMSGMMYAFRIYNNGVLVRDFRPIAIGNTGYMLDMVSGQYLPFGNAGTGDFVLGPDVVPVEYIESHGTEYIDSGVKATSNIRIEIRAAITSNNCWLFGGRTAYHNAALGIYRTPEGAFRANYAATDYETNGDALVHVFEQNKNIFSLDGTLVRTFAENSFASQSSIYLFNLTIDEQGTPSNIGLIGKGYYCKIWDNGNLVRKFASVRVGSGSTWEGAMMDVLTRRIYRNAGTGAFSYGNDLPVGTLAN